MVNVILITVVITVIMTLVLLQLSKIVWRYIGEFKNKRTAIQAYAQLEKTNPKYLDFLAKEFKDVSDEEMVKYIILGTIYEEDTAEEKLIDFARRLKESKNWSIKGSYVYIEK